MYYLSKKGKNKYWNSLFGTQEKKRKEREIKEFSLLLFG